MGVVLRSWYESAVRTLEDTALAVQTRQVVQLKNLEALASDVVSSLQDSDGLVVQALSGPAGSPLVTNLINVAILGTKVGIGLGYYGEELRKLALAGLIHDIGLFAVPKELITKSGRLTQEERTLIERHPERGYEIIAQCGPAYRWLAELVREAHERHNGHGYPNRLKGRQIHEMAQICGVVDVFDALVSERPYRRRLLPHEAVKELLVAERATFPREILKALVEQLSVYPLGTTVRLTTGEVGVVAKINSRYPLRPVVSVSDQEKQEGAEPRHIDLSVTPLISIGETLNPPVVGNLAFTNVRTKNPMSATATVASDSFTALLESLDAVASTIQGVVDAQKSCPPTNQ